MPPIASDTDKWTEESESELNLMSLRKLLRFVTQIIRQLAAELDKSMHELRAGDACN